RRGILQEPGGGGHTVLSELGWLWLLRRNEQCRTLLLSRRESYRAGRTELREHAERTVGGADSAGVSVQHVDSRRSRSGLPARGAAHVRRLRGRSSAGHCRVLRDRRLAAAATAGAIRAVEVARREHRPEPGGE